MTLARLNSVLSHHELSHIISAYGYWAVALIIAFECLGLPLPGESILIGAAALGAILGNTIGYWIGREGGYRLLLRYGPRLNITHGRIKLGQYLFLNHGGKIVFFGRFFAVVRVFAALLAGANRMNWLSFLFFNIAGGIVWAILFGSGGYYLGGKLHLGTRYAGLGSGLAAAILVVAAVVFLRRQEAQLQSKAERALPGPLKAP